jgi:hypothetical protein
MLFTLALLAPMFNAPGAAAGATHSAAQEKVKDKDDEKHEPPDPCEQLLKVKGEAKGLHLRCETGGSGGAAKGDFNKDGFADLAIGAPYEDQNGVGGVGGVNIIYGSAAGLTSSGTTAPNDQFLDETTFGFPYHSSDHFGWALASGDFNGDDYSDLAIGMPDWDLLSGVDATNHGVVFVINGSATGLDTATARTAPSLNGSGGRKGAALVWADFNGDGFGDLAVGHPNAKVKSDGFACSPASFDVQNAGEVQVLYGSMQGLTTFGAQVFRQGVCEYSAGVGIGDSPEEGDGFGSSLAAIRDANGADLVIGAPLEDLGLFDKQDAGMIHLLRGLSDGLSTFPTQTITQDTAGVGGAAETGDQFGRVLVTGNFGGGNNLSRFALAVGIPFEDLVDNTRADGGAVQVFLSGTGTDVVSASGSLFISQSNLSGVSVETGDLFGWSLAAGDFDGDLRDDLAIGVPGEDVGSITNAGMVTVLYGSSSGPSLTRIQHWHQDSSGILDVAEPGDQFGYAVAAWNYGKDSRSDLAVGAPFEDIVSASTGTLQQDAGAVHVIYGSSVGLSSTSNQFWHQDSSGIKDVAQPGDRFGNALY